MIYSSLFINTNFKTSIFDTLTSFWNSNNVVVAYKFSLSILNPNCKCLDRFKNDKRMV